MLFYIKVSKASVISRCLPMSEYEELQLLHQLRRVPTMSDVPGPVRRLYRKLCVRRLKRERGMPLFNLDDTRPGIRNSRVVPHMNPALRDIRILDRFQVNIENYLCTLLELQAEISIQRLTFRFYQAWKETQVCFVGYFGVLMGLICFFKHF